MTHARSLGRDSQLNLLVRNRVVNAGPHQPSRSMSFRGLRSLHRRSVTDMADEAALSASASTGHAGARMPAVAEEP